MSNTNIPTTGGCIMTRAGYTTKAGEYRPLGMAGSGKGNIYIQNNYGYNPYAAWGSVPAMYTVPMTTYPMCPMTMYGGYPMYYQASENKTAETLAYAGLGMSVLGSITELFTGNKEA